MIFQRANFGFGFLAVAITDTDLSLTMQPGHYLPIASGPMRLVIWNSILYPVPITDPNWEVVTAYYSGTPNVYTIVRAQEDTMAHPHLAGDKLAMTYTQGVSTADLSVIGSKEVDESAIGDKKVLVFNAITNRIEYGLGGGGSGGGGAVTKTLWVDKNRTDVYTADGSTGLPYKTIQAAVNRIIANNDNALYSYLIEIAPGVYHETIILESVKLRNVYFHGNGEVVIQPLGSVTSSGQGASYEGSSGGSGGPIGPLYAVRSLTNNANLLTLHFDGIDFEAPFVLVGQNGGRMFSDVYLDNCEFTSDGASMPAGGTIDLTCVNNFNMVECRSTEPILLNNVWWSYFNACQLEGDFVATVNETLVPASGKDCMALFNATYLQGAVSFSPEVPSEGGTATFTLVANGSRIGKGNPVTIPPEVTIYAQNSFLRGRWTNNGLVILSNSFVQSFNQAGVGVLNVDDQPASQLRNDSLVPGVTIKDALNNLLSQAGTINHALLTNLDYAHAGHTGFQKELVWDADYAAYLACQNN